jgi:hypothetical protein
MFALSKDAKSAVTGTPQKEKIYIAINAGNRYPLLKAHFHAQKQQAS